MTLSLEPQTLDLDEYAAPTFSSVEEEREHRRLRLAAAFRIFARFGFEHGLAGHITVRDPEHSDCLWVNPICVPFGRICVSDLLLVDATGRVVHGRRPVNETAFAIHSQIHAARDDVVAVAHAHAPHGVTWSATARHLRPVNQDACAFYDDHAVYDDFGGLVVDVEEGRRIAAALGPTKAVVMRNHGVLTVGDCVDAAVWWFVQMERCCQVELALLSSGLDPVLISEPMAKLTYSQLGTPLSGRVSAKSLFDQVLAEHPELPG